MTHDPLCPYRPAPPDEYAPFEATVPCHCDLIAKVRADEREQAGQRVRSLRNYGEGLMRVAAAVAAGDTDAGVGW